MVSINSAARYAIANLRMVNADLNVTQNRISSGLRINSAKDDASVWRAAANMRTDLKSHEAVGKSLTTAKAVVDTAAAGTDAVATALADLKGALAAYQSADTATKATAFIAVETAQKQVLAATNVSAGVNLIDNADSYTYASSVGASGVVTSNLVTVDILATVNEAAIGGTSNLTTFLTTFTSAEFDVAANTTEIMSDLSTAITTVTDYAATLGAASARIDSQIAMNKALVSTKESALSSMVDADLEEESAKLQALQVKQQLAYQALSIANASSQNILRLFQ